MDSLSEVSVLNVATSEKLYLKDLKKCDELDNRGSMQERPLKTGLACTIKPEAATEFNVLVVRN